MPETMFRQDSKLPAYNTNGDFFFVEVCCSGMWRVAVCCGVVKCGAACCGDFKMSCRVLQKVEV